MLIKALRAFHERTLRQYRQMQQEEMPEWMKTVMRIHEESGILFYYEEHETGPEGDMILRGEPVKGSIRGGDRLNLYSGEGRFLAAVVVTEEPEEPAGEKPAGGGKNIMEIRVRPDPGACPDLRGRISLVSDVFIEGNK